MKTLIIEDEIKTARELSTLITGIRSDFEILDILPSVKSALKWFDENEDPELIFADIQLADGLSFDLFKTIETTCPVIFCTAFDEYAIKAFEHNGIDYLLKPIDEHKLEQSLKKYERLKRSFAPEQAQDYEKKLLGLLNQLGRQSYKSSLLVYFQEKIVPVKTADIAFIYSTGGIVTLYNRKNQQFLLHQTLDELEALLKPSDFFRINRQFIVHREVIVLAEHFFNRRLALRLSCETPERVLVSKVKASAFLIWLGE